MREKVKLLTCKEAANLLGFSADYVRRMCSANVIHAEKKGGHWLMTERALVGIGRQRHKKENGNGSSERSVETDSESN